MDKSDFKNTSQEALAGEPGFKHSRLIPSNTITQKDSHVILTCQPISVTICIGKV